MLFITRLGVKSKSMKKNLTVIILAVLLTAPTNAFAQDYWFDQAPGVLPDTPIKYLLEGVKEKLSLLFTFNAEKKAEKMLDLAEERLAEAEAELTYGHPEITAKMLKKYEKQLVTAEKKVMQLKEQGKDVQPLIEKLAGMGIRHQAALRNMYRRSPEEMKDAAQQAIDTSQQGLDAALEVIAEEKKSELVNEVKMRIGNLEEKLPAEVIEKLPMLMETEETEEAE